MMAKGLFAVAAAFVNLALAAAFVPSLAPARPPTRASSITCVYADDETAKAKWLAERTDEKATTDVTAAAGIDLKDSPDGPTTWSARR